MYDQPNVSDAEVQPRDENERRLLVLFGPDEGPVEIRKLREQQAKKDALKLSPLLRQEMWIKRLEPERSTPESRRRLWPRIAAREASYRPFELAQAFAEVLEMERVGHCAAYRADYWWHKEHELWLRDSRGNLMHQLFMKTFGSDIEGWLNDGDEEERRRFSLAAVHQVIEIARRSPGIALTPADVDPTPPAKLLDVDAMRTIPPSRSLLTFRGQRLIPSNALGVLVGDSETYKSYFAVKLAATIACGKPSLADFALDYKADSWVIYIGAEDADGLAHRLVEACDQLRGGTEGADPRLALFNQSVVITDTNAVLDLIVRVKQHVPTDAPVSLIVVDTYNQSLGPDDSEDSADTARNFALGMRLLNRAFAGCTVMTVHHPPKNDPTGVRGSGGIRHNTDFMLGFTREPGTARIGVTCKKQKNGPAFAPFTLTFVTSTDGIRLGNVEPGAKVVEPKRGRPKSDLLAGTSKTALTCRAIAQAGPTGLTREEIYAVASATTGKATIAAMEDRKLGAWQANRFSLTMTGKAHAEAQGWLDDTKPY